LILGVYLSLEPGLGPEKENSTQLQIDLNPKKKKRKETTTYIAQQWNKRFQQDWIFPIKKRFGFSTSNKLKKTQDRNFESNQQKILGD
jgi:hypothetical protein